MKIVETDNFGGDYPDESFLNLPSLRRDLAQEIADRINLNFTSAHPRFWKVVDDDYTLSPGFEP